MHFKKLRHIIPLIILSICTTKVNLTHSLPFISSVPEIKKRLLESNLSKYFNTNGFFELQNIYVDKKFYQDTYINLEKIITKYNNSKSFRRDLQILKKAFKLSENNAIFSGVPMGYRNCSLDSNKLDNKKYFQFSSEYYEFVKDNYEHILQRHEILRSFFNKLEYIDYATKILLKHIVISLKKTHPIIEDILYKNRKDFTVVIKVLSYDKSCNEMHTSPHYDKSALSIILDNDDIENNKLVLSPWKKNFDFKDLNAPERKFDLYNNSSSSILLPGILLSKQGTNINPVPHAVLASTAPVRHSIIAFALVPYLDLSKIKTTIVKKYDFNNKKQKSL